MINRIYAHNFRCLENFELKLAGASSVLLIGKNGAGKTTVGAILELLQKIARGTNRVGELLRPKDFTRGRTDAPMSFEIEVELNKKVYQYKLALELPEGFRELRVSEEELHLDGKKIFERQQAQVKIVREGRESGASFRIDWHLIALSIVQQPSDTDPISVFRLWLENMLVFRPTPSLIRGDSEADTLHPNAQLTNFGAWFAGLLASEPSAYTDINDYLKHVMPDFDNIKNPSVGPENRSLVVQFSKGEKTFKLPFNDLSDGEKCFMVCALTIAANNAYGPLLCFWDEPDNFLAPSEVGSATMALRKAFRKKGQLILTSHNPQAIRQFSDENTLVLYRNSHLEPAIVKTVSDYRSSGSLEGNFVDAILRGDLSS